MIGAQLAGLILRGLQYPSDCFFRGLGSFGYRALESDGGAGQPGACQYDRCWDKQPGRC